MLRRFQALRVIGLATAQVENLYIAPPAAQSRRMVPTPELNVASVETPRRRNIGVMERGERAIAGDCEGGGRSAFRAAQRRRVPERFSNQKTKFVRSRTFDCPRGK